VKVFQNILSIILVTAFFNVVIAKSVHEFFEHEHELELCSTNDLNHFHQHEFTHADFICDFNFSTSLISKKKVETKDVVRYYEKQLQVKFLWLVKNIFLGGLSLRGPPMIK